MAASNVDLFTDLFRPVPTHPDERGAFVKVLSPALFPERQAKFDVSEVFWTRSGKHVVRGLHYQSPPHAVEKVVWCSSGRAFDVVLDLRSGSPTFGRSRGFYIAPDCGNVVVVPEGFAHGFCALEDDTTIGYLQSGLHAPDHDRGILWSSIEIDWPVADDVAVLSERDRSFETIDDHSPVF